MSHQKQFNYQFGDQFKYKIHEKASHLATVKDSYALSLLGFRDEVAVHSIGTGNVGIAVDKLESCRAVQVTFESASNKPKVHIVERRNTTAVEVDVCELQHRRNSTNIEVEQSKNSTSTEVMVNEEFGKDKPQEVDKKERKNLASSVFLQGKKVIIRTNSMSGAKSLIFKQKTGQNVEIPAKLCTVLNPNNQNVSLPEVAIKKEPVPIKLVENVVPTNVAFVAGAPNSDYRHKPAILKRTSKLHYQIIPNDKKLLGETKKDKVKNTIVKVEENCCVSSEETVLQCTERNRPPFDHNYYSVASSASSKNKIENMSSTKNVFVLDHLGIWNKPLNNFSQQTQEVIEVVDEDVSVRRDITTNQSLTQTLMDELPPLVPIQGAGRKLLSRNIEIKQNATMSEEQVPIVAEANETGEVKKVQLEVKRSEPEKQMKTIENHMKPPAFTSYEIYNTNLIKKEQNEKSTAENKKNTFIVMIANKEMLEKKKKETPAAPAFKMEPKLIKNTVIPSNYKLPFQKKPKKHQSVQTSEPCTPTRTVETNTDDFLLQELIEKKVQERAVQNKVTKTTNTEDFTVFTSNCDERITPSPFLMVGDPLDLLEFLDDPNDNVVNIAAPIIMDNVNFGGAPTIDKVNASFAGKTINGKAIESHVSSNIMDISYSRGKSIYNGGFNGIGLNMTAANAWPPNIIANNGCRSQIEPWKLQLFLDLKNCHQFDASGNMPIHNAVIENNLTTVRRQCLALRARQIDVNTLNHNALTPLQLALLHDASVLVVKTLLQYGSDTSVLDPDGNNVLHICITNSSEAVAQMLLSSTVCADINATNFEGYTPLILCSLHQKYVKADALLSTGADPNIGDKKSGRTPLFHAVEANDVEMVKLLLDYKAQTKVRNFFGTSPHDAMFELDTIDHNIRKLVLTKDESINKPKLPEIKGRRKRKPNDDDDVNYSVRSYGGKNNKKGKSRRLSASGSKKS